jgi:hypothetical protein
MFPKKTVKIEDIKSKKEIDLLQKNIKQALCDIHAGRSKTIRVID